MRKCRSVLLHGVLITLGGLCYNLLELLWRGRTHWSMFLVGGLCFECIGLIHRHFRHRHLVVRSLLGSAAVTVVEFVSGCVVNLWWGLGVWDYSGVPLNVAGQVCLLYSVFWAVLAGAVGPLYACLRRWLEQGLDRLTLFPGNSQPGDTFRI